MWLAKKQRMADNQWMYSGFIRRNRVTSEWIAKTDVYLKEIFRRPMRIIPPCPCARCARRHRRNQTDMSEHLRTHGYMPNFDMPPINIAEQDRGREEVMRQRIDGYEDDGVRDMLDDVIVAETANATPSENEPEEPEATAKAFLEVLASSKKPLYAGAKISQLDAISQLIAVKAEYGCSQKCFEAFLGVWANSLPEGHELPKSMYDTKKIMKALSMDYEKIDVCPKNCLLFRHEYADDKYCRKCGSSRYIEVVGEDGEKKQLTIPVKVLRYLDFIKRLQRLFITKESAKMMKWHKEGIRYNPKKIVHPSEGEAWKSFDEEYPEEAAEAGNVRIAISGDGLNPYGMSSNPYSCWPVFVIPLNLPPGALMQRKTMFLSLIIPGPEYPGKQLGVFMQPLVDALHHSWYFPRLTYDRDLQRNFLMKVWLHYCMHDFPGYALFCGWCTSGKMPCPVCMQALRMIWLSKGGKYVAFDLHRQFLPPDHPDREDKKNFTKGRVVHEVTEIPTFSGADVLAQLKALKPKVKGKGKAKAKGFEGYGETHNWTHITPFSQLPYFKDLKLPYNIDVMHTEKNVAESLFHTILNIPDKTKDNVKARADQQRICDRPRLNMKPPTGGRKNWFKPDADFVLKPPEKKEVLIWLKHILKFTDGYASNISKGVNLSTGKVTGLKSHDYHVWIERIMPVMVRGYVPEHVWRVLAELSHFFRTLCAKEVSKDVIEKLHKKAPELIVKLEKIFPPGFFTPMTHLILHLANEVLLGGPVQNRWQYGPERQNKHLRQKCGNKAKIEASIAEAVILEEVSDLRTSYYPDHVPHLHNKVPRYNIEEPKYQPRLDLFNAQGGRAGASKSYNMPRQEWEDLMFYILHNIKEVEEVWMR